MVMRAVKQAVSVPRLSATIQRELRDVLQEASWLAPASVNEWLALSGRCLPGTLLLLSGGLGALGEERLLPCAVAMELMVLARQVREDAHREFLYARALGAVTHLPAFVIQAFADVLEASALQRLREDTQGLDLTVTEEQYLEHVYARSGLLLATCGQLGARLAASPAETIEALTMYGFALGMALQIQEDMRPWLGGGYGGFPRAQVPRARVQDSRLPMPVIHSLLHSEQTRLLLTSTSRVPVKSLTRCLRQSGSLLYTDSVVSTYIHKATASLSVLPSSAVKTALLDLLSTLSLDLGKE